MNLSIKCGDFLNLGVTIYKNEITFTIECEIEDTCRIVLIHHNSGKRYYIDVSKEYCIGSLRSICVSGFLVQEYDYLYEINGEEVLDPYARKVVGREQWDDPNRYAENFPLYSGFSHIHFDWKGDCHPKIPKNAMVLYKLHVRGFSMGSTQKESIRGTFSAIKNKISYLKGLGISSLELMPIYEFEEIDASNNKLNVWGYTEGNYFAPKASYGKSPESVERELKTFIKELHKNNMELIMEMFFPAGIKAKLIIDALRFWVKEYHIDGFHILGEEIPIAMIVQDPMLSRTKIFADGFDGISVKKQYHNLFVYRDEYQFPARQLLNHYHSNLQEFVNQQKKQGQFLGYVNYICSNNGFTLADLFMYQEKHNEANGENNVDGPDFNFSNNFGVEGKTRKKFICDIRRRNMRNAFMMLLFAQGVPLIFSGDEFGNSQKGNNNAYCQDNPIGWVDWTEFHKYKKERDFIKKLIQFRKEHGIVANEEPFHFQDYRLLGLPDLSYHGENAWISQIDPGKKTIGMLYFGAYDLVSKNKEDIYVGYNFYSEELRLALPNCGPKKQWYLKFDSSCLDLEDEKKLENQKFIKLGPNTISVLVAK